MKLFKILFILLFPFFSLSAITLDDEGEECGMFLTALSSFTDVNTSQNDIYETCVISSANYSYGEDSSHQVTCHYDNLDAHKCSCSTANCSINNTCTIVLQPDNTYGHEFFTTSSDVNTTVGADTTLTALNNGNFTFTGSNNDTTLNPLSSYDNADTKVMLLGDVVVGGNNHTMTFNSGDYYIKSFTVNNNGFTMIINGDVRIFVEEDFDLQSVDMDATIASSLFMHVGGDAIFSNFGGGNSLIKMFLYVENDMTIASNAATANWNGGVISEGSLSVTGNNINFTYDREGAEHLGMSRCIGGGTTPELGVFDAWETVNNGPDVTLIDKNITTKIANKSFSLTLASLNDARDAFVDRSGIRIQYILFNYDFENNTTTSIGTLENLNPDTTTDISFPLVSSAYRDVRVRFSYCQETNTSSIVDMEICDDYAGSSSYAFVNSVASTDEFAIRPDKFIVSAPAGENINLLKSANDYNFILNAPRFNSVVIATPLYTTTVNNTNFNIANTMYIDDVTPDTNGSLFGTFFTSTIPTNMNEGTGIAGINFDDVGKSKITIQDITWANVDIDDTVGDCSATGRYICGDINATFIPDNFAMTDITVLDEDNATFTYLSDDLAMSAHIGTTVTARNANGATTRNFASDFWENQVNVNIAVTPQGSLVLNPSNITATSLGFVDGEAIVEWNQTTTDSNLMFNFDRDVNDSKNPFILYASAITLSASSTYTDSADSVTITGTGTGVAAADNNATFVYGRTYAPRYRFTGSGGTAFINYEVFCNGVDSDGRTCSPSLLPNGITSQPGDDYRWYINTSHTNEVGTAGAVTRKGGGTHVTTTGTTTTNPASSDITYDGTKGYPYKTTMQNSASTWLIYNRFNPGAPANEFDVEFEGGASEWSGLHESESSTESNSSATKTNRRSMW